MPKLFPLQLLLASFAGWANRRQAQTIGYLAQDCDRGGHMLEEMRPRCDGVPRWNLSHNGFPTVTGTSAATTHHG